MKILVLDPNYPNENNLYGDVFVHVRVKEYLKQHEVLVVDLFKQGPDFIYEGVTVKRVWDMSVLNSVYRDYNPDVVFIHFYTRELAEFAQQVEVPIFVWIHGFEALGWYRRTFNYSWHYLVRKVPNLAYADIKRLIGLRALIAKSNGSREIYFIFVSEWMKRITEKDNFISVKKSYIIPNPINTERFGYFEKATEKRLRILSIRPYHNRKYANDIAISSILKLSEKKYFKNLNFELYGAGILFDRLTKPLRGFQNIQLYNNFLPNESIPGVHKKHGIFLCPTRQDAQGVSMCEAMSSGLVPITSNNTAIPEYVIHRTSGFLTNSDTEICEAIEELYYNEALFSQLSMNAANSIREKCDLELIIQKELKTVQTII